MGKLCLCFVALMDSLNEKFQWQWRILFSSRQEFMSCSYSKLCIQMWKMLFIHGHIYNVSFSRVATFESSVLLNNAEVRKSIIDIFGHTLLSWLVCLKCNFLPPSYFCMNPIDYHNSYADRANQRFLSLSDFLCSIGVICCIIKMQPWRVCNHLLNIYLSVIMTSLPFFRNCQETLLDIS